jgi:hypothetical protein
MGVSQDEETWIFETAEPKEVVVTLAQDAETGFDPEYISSDRVGRVLGKDAPETRATPWGEREAEVADHQGRPAAVAHFVRHATSKTTFS